MEFNGISREYTALRSIYKQYMKSILNEMENDSLSSCLNRMHNINS